MNAPKRDSALSAEGEGFEPSIDEKTPITVFETAAFNHSATPPGDRFVRLAAAQGQARTPGPVTA